jgi:MOSC domain-containing protein YiiM
LARLLSVNVGRPREISWRGQTVYTSVWKEPVKGRRLVRRLNIDGDAQGDLAGHGGEQRAVFVYQMDSYRYRERELKRSDFTFGQFGENFTVEGLADSVVCVGDRYRIGGALFEVTQPRVTCYRLGIRMNEPRMPALLVEHHRPGFYFRVLKEGEVGDDDAFMQRRMDYSPDVTGNPPIAHYTHDYQTFDGFVFPTRRLVYLHDASGVADKGFAPITIDVNVVTADRG